MYKNTADVAEVYDALENGQRVTAWRYASEDYSPVCLSCDLRGKALCWEAEDLGFVATHLGRNFRIYDKEPDYVDRRHYRSRDHDVQILESLEGTTDLANACTCRGFQGYVFMTGLREVLRERPVLWCDPHTGKLYVMPKKGYKRVVCRAVRFSEE